MWSLLTLAIGFSLVGMLCRFLLHLSAWKLYWFFCSAGRNMTCCVFSNKSLYWFYLVFLSLQIYGSSPLFMLLWVMLFLLMGGISLLYWCLTLKSANLSATFYCSRVSPRFRLIGSCIFSILLASFDSMGFMTSS